MAWKPAGGWRGQMCPNKRLADLGRRPREGPVTPERLPCPLPMPRAATVTHGSRKGCPCLAPTCPSQPKASPGWAGNLCVLGQEKRHRAFRGAWAVSVPGPAPSVPGPPWHTEPARLCAHPGALRAGGSTARGSQVRSGPAGALPPACR